MQNSDLLWFKSRVVNDDATNGGRLSTDQIISGVIQNTFPHVWEADRLAGNDIIRKVFAKLHYAGLATASFAKIWQDILTAADDSVVWFPGTQRDVAGDFTIASKRKYGCGDLVADVAAGDSAFSLDLDHPDWKSTDPVFQVGDTFRIADRDDPTNTSVGQEEIGEIATVTPDATLNRVAITTVAPLSNSYTVASGARAMSYIDFGELKPDYDSWTETDSGDAAKDIYNVESFSPLLDCQGTDEESIVLEFTTASDFIVTGDTFGDMGSGNVTTDYEFLHPVWGRRVILLEAAGWLSGTAAGDKVSLVIHPSAIPLWLYKRTPANSGSLAGNSVVHVQSCEAAV